MNHRIIQHFARWTPSFRSNSISLIIRVYKYVRVNGVGFSSLLSSTTSTLVLFQKPPKFCSYSLCYRNFHSLIEVVILSIRSPVPSDSQFFHPSHFPDRESPCLLGSGGNPRIHFAEVCRAPRRFLSEKDSVEIVVFDASAIATDMDDNVGIPEVLRCKRSDGKQWRCSALSMPDKTVCEKHYIQAKRRAANSAMRANLKKVKRKSIDHDMNDDEEMSVSPLNNNGAGGEYSSHTPTKKHKGKVRKGHGYYSPDVTLGQGGSSARSGFREEVLEEVIPTSGTPSRGKVSKNFGRSSKGEHHDKNTDSSDEAEGLTCHQCQRNDRVRVLWCMSCNKRGYCDSCIARCYADISMDDIRRACPACRGICSCILCRPGDTIIKTRIHEIPTIKRLKYLHSLLSFTLPMLKQIHSEHCSELDVENRINGIKSDIPRAMISPDQQMCCDICSTPIVDYHRHCTNCMSDICLHCIRDLRGYAKEMHGEYIAKSQFFSSKDSCTLDFSHLFPKWKVNKDGSVPCPNHCRSSLVLRRIFKINWVAKLVKNAEEMVTGCRVSENHSSERCISCSGTEIAKPSGFSESNLCECSHREDSGDNFLYTPASKDITPETIAHFFRHWSKGEPIIVRQVIDCTSASSWDPEYIWRGIQEALRDRRKENNVLVKAIDCSSQSEVDIELEEFVRGYSEGHIGADNTLEILKLKDWPHPEALEDFLVCQRPELLAKLPFLEYIHSRWGLLNIAAKLPCETLQTDAGPRLHIGYGLKEELGIGDSVMNLKINMGDTVHLLMHMAEVKIPNKHHIENERPIIPQKASCLNENQRDMHVFDFNEDEPEKPNSLVSPSDEHHAKSDRFSIMSSDEDNDVKGKTGNSSAVEKADVAILGTSFLDTQEEDCVAVIWDVFRRQDIPKLNEYIKVHSEEFGVSDNPSSTNQIENPVYDQVYFLNKDHKQKLREELGIEPWTFKQKLGEAVFIPAGCAFQTRNLKSAVQLALDFLLPESLAESNHVAQEIRCLPNDHTAKLQMQEVAIMPLYAASWAIREVQKIVLDPVVGLELGFEDRNLTGKVSENLRRMIKQNQIASVQVQN